MNQFFRISIVVFSVVVIYLFVDMNKAPAQTTSQVSNSLPLTVDATKILNNNVMRLALNVGEWNTWGSQQLGINLIQNPGFEGEIRRAIVFVSQSDSASFSDDKSNIYVDGLWNGADWEVRTGSSQGAKGKVTRSVVSGANGYPQYFSDASVPKLSAGDVIILSKQVPGDMSKLWYLRTPTNIALDPTPRTGSPGTQSLLMRGDLGNAQASYFMDSIANQSGTKFVLIDGSWKLSFWAKAQGTGQLAISFKRFGTPDFFNQTITPTADWKLYTYDFKAVDSGVTDGIEFKLSASGAKIWVDDMSLTRVEPGNTTAYRQVVIDTIKELRPSFLRARTDYGSTFENLIAPPFARKYSLEQMRNADSIAVYDFSLGEFLDLCAAVGSNPWITIPETFSAGDYFKLGQYLVQNAGKNRFSEVIIEFGNENWNTVFRPQVFLWPYYAKHGLVAQMAFENIASAAGQNANLRFVVGGQHANPYTSFSLLDGVAKADTLTTGAYFLESLDTGVSDSQALSLLFAEDPGQLKEHADGLKQRGKSFAIYEFNLHTTAGNAPGSQRDRVVAGRASGAALAKRALYVLSLGADPATVYSLSQFDSKAWNISDRVKLWGITKTFGPPLALRPTGLAMLMLNRVIAGDMYAIKPVNPSTTQTNNLTTAAFKASDAWTAAVVSQNNTEVSVSIQFPNDSLSVPTTYLVLNSSTPFDTNELKENVAVVQKSAIVNGRTVTVTVPAWSLVVLGTTNDTVKPPTTPSTPPPSQPPVTPTTPTTPTTPPPSQPPVTPTTPTPKPPTTPTTPTTPPPSQPPVTPTTPPPKPPTTPTPSSEKALEDLKQKVQDLDKKQQQILKELQDLINIMGTVNNG